MKFFYLIQQHNETFVYSFTLYLIDNITSRQKTRVDIACNFALIEKTSGRTIHKFSKKRRRDQLLCQKTGKIIIIIYSSLLCPRILNCSHIFVGEPSIAGHSSERAFNSSQYVQGHKIFSWTTKYILFCTGQHWVDENGKYLEEFSKYK